MTETVVEHAPAKVNLVLEVGRRLDSGLHELCSLFASIELADEVTVSPGSADEVSAAGVEGPNLAARALTAFREAAPDAALPPVAIAIEKRIPVAAGLGGGSADAAATLRAANRIAGGPLGAAQLRELAAGLGSDVPSQVEPGHAIVSGTGERIEAVGLPVTALVLLPAASGLATADVYAEHDRLGGPRERLESQRLHDLADDLAGAGPRALADSLQNDLQQASLSLRPELSDSLDALRAAGALGASVCGSGPTVFGVFESDGVAAAAADGLDGAIATRMRAA